MIVKLQNGDKFKIISDGRKQLEGDIKNILSFLQDRN